MEGQLSLLDLIRPPVLRLPVDVDGHVLQGEPAEQLVFRVNRDGNECWIQLHPSARGWMWAVRFEGPQMGHSYKVGEKWGKFAPDRETALDEAVAELLDDCDLHDSAHGPCPFVRQARRWAEGLR